MPLNLLLFLAMPTNLHQKFQKYLLRNLNLKLHCAWSSFFLLWWNDMLKTFTALSTSFDPSQQTISSSCAAYFCLSKAWKIMYFIAYEKEWMKYYWKLNYDLMLCCKRNGMTKKNWELDKNSKFWFFFFVNIIFHRS